MDGVCIEIISRVKNCQKVIGQMLIMSMVECKVDLVSSKSLVDKVQETRLCGVRKITVRVEKIAMRCKRNSTICKRKRL